MSDQLIVHHCAPTLAGLKAGSLFSCPCRDAGQLTGELRRLNRALAPKGLRVLPLQTEKGRALIYLYRPRALERELEFLQARGSTIHPNTQGAYEWMKQKKEKQG